MCGIIGYTGPRQAAPLLLDGLRRLEYRGYDSAGIAALDDGRLEVVKAPGKIAALEQLVKQTPLRGGAPHAGSRWATRTTSWRRIRRPGCPTRAIVAPLTTATWPTSARPKTA
jgi:glucosamine--fructose-6-phosphate aminotransferase (isomerizing)